MNKGPNNEHGIYLLKRVILRFISNTFSKYEITVLLKFVLHNIHRGCPIRTSEFYTPLPLCSQTSTRPYSPDVRIFLKINFEINFAK